MKPLIEIIDTTNEPNIIEQIMKANNHGGKRKGAGRPPKESKMVMTSIRLPLEVKQSLTTREKREAILTAFRAKINKK